MFLPKGTNVVLNIFHMQRRADIYEKPLEFIPERFSTLEKIESKNAFSWLPFSAGPRNCIGNLLLKIMILTIAVRFGGKLIYRVHCSNVSPNMANVLIL